ncbi:MAG TPA: PqqD family protein [Acidiferrobacteraceae bacterium]|nr:PqqD family protein [Acidiferrobacteraceae bacterium]
MISPSTIYKPRKDVRYRIVSDEAVVVRQQSTEVIVLNEVAARILQLLDAHTTLSELIHALEAEFDIDPPQLEHDVMGFIKELLEAGVIIPTVPSALENGDVL